MLKIVGGVIAGYLVMFILIFVTFSGAYLAMGTDGAFKPGSYDVTPLWIGVSTVLGLGAAIAGGFVCALIAKDRRGPLALAGLVLILGILMAIPILTGADNGAPPVRDASVGNLQAMQYAKTPAWVALLNPILGAVGAVIGGKRKS
jgi:hypothetical protein